MPESFLRLLENTEYRAKSPHLSFCFHFESRNNGETTKPLGGFDLSLGNSFGMRLRLRADTDPTFALRDALITPRNQHRAAMTKRDDFKSLVQTISTFKGSFESTITALKLMTFPYTRPGELRLSYWDGFDLKNGVWMIPALRMKMRRAHAKSLSQHVID